MYFQNPPTNFIDKFVLIINPLQMNVNFFLGHQCKILRLPRKNCGKDKHIFSSFYCADLRLPIKNIGTARYIFTSFYCAYLRLHIKKCVSGRYLFTSLHCADLLVRLKILRLYFGLPMHNSGLFV